MTFSTNWKSSKQPRKQRKYRYLAPAHIRGKFLHVHLSAELRTKHNKRNIRLVTGDKVKVLRGQFKGHTGKVERINADNEKALISGIEVQKKDGNKTEYPINVTNLIITELNLDDKKRNQRIKE